MEMGILLIIRREMISKNEVENLNAVFDKILSSAVEEKDFEYKLPLDGKLSDSNKVYSGKVSVMFIDIRNSTKLPDKYTSAEIVKVYRAYARAVVQGVRYNGGVVRDYMGDGLLAFFLDDNEHNSSDNAVAAARYISTIINLLLNPLMKKRIRGLQLSFGIGICSGKIMMTKVGMRGKESDPDSEDEHGIAWIGDATNKASKFSGAVGKGDIFIDYATYKGLSDKSDGWVENGFVINGNNLQGYVASKYYLDIDSDIVMDDSNGDVETYTAESETNIINKCIKEQLQQIREESEKLGEQREWLRKKENEIVKRERNLNDKEDELNDEKLKSLQEQLDICVKILNSAYCKKEYINAMGLKFWLQIYEQIKLIAGTLNIDMAKLKGERIYGLLDIYCEYGCYEKAYDFLVLKAKHSGFFCDRHIEEIITKTGNWSALKNALVDRLRKKDMDIKYFNDFNKALKVIADMGY